MKLTDRVMVYGIGPGWITKIRYDDSGEPLYDILMEKSDATLDGLYLARRSEIGLTEFSA